MMQNDYNLSLKEETYSPQKNATTVKFSAFVKEQRKLLGEEIEGKTVSTKDLAKRMGLDYEVFRKIINKQKPTKKRDFIIVLCAILYLDPDKTNEALSLYGMPELDEKNERDRVLKNILDDRAYYLPTADEYEEQGESSQLVIQEIDNRLSLYQQTLLDIADRRGRKTAMKACYPYTLLRKRVSCGTDDLLYEDPFASLQTRYAPDRYQIIAEMWLVDNRDHREYHLIAEPEGLFSKMCLTDGEPPIQIERFYSPGEAGEFKDCFIELRSMAVAEFKRLLSCLKDTKSFRGRKSAGIIDGHLHVFFEEFNYTVPELGEYYLLDYSEGRYRFSVSDESRFMELYLKPDLYKKLYRKKATVNEEYESAEENTDILFQNAGNNAFIGLRRSAFRYMKEELDVFIETIRKKETKIRNADLAFEAPSDLLQYFGIVSDHIEQDNRIIDLIALKNAFELGLDSVEEIGSFLRNCKSLEISELI